MTKFKAVTQVIFQDHETLVEELDTEGVTNAVAIARSNARQRAQQIVDNDMVYTAFVLGDTVVTKVEDVSK
jgi:hypothetical protein